MHRVALTVLLVDPSRDSAQTIRNSFSRFGPCSHELFHVVTIASAADILSRYQVDIVLLDPFITDAVDLETDIATLRDSAAAPVIVITDIEDAETAEAAIRAGAIEYLVKGTLAGRALMRTVRQAVERHGMSMQLDRERRSAEAAKVQFQNLIASNSDAMLVIDEDGIIRFANDVAGQLMQRPVVHLIGSRFGIPLEGADNTEINLMRFDGKNTTAEMRVMETVWEDTPAYLATLRDISARKEAERALQTAKQQAEEASEMKSQFLANMSHELRTPLNSILGFAEIMQTETLGPVGNQKYVEYVDFIHKSGSHLLNLINELLDLSKAEAGRLELYETSFDVSKTIEAAVGSMQTQAEHGHVRLNLANAMPHGWCLYGDERMISQIVLNLVSNAIKFTPQGGQVRVEFGITDEGIFSLQVSDSGIGIKQEELSRIFLAYVQAGHSETRQAQQGTGLGLALCKNFVERHGGTISVDSEYGHGTSVTVMLPEHRVRDEHGIEETGVIDLSTIENPVRAMANIPISRNSFETRVGSRIR